MTEHILPDFFLEKIKKMDENYAQRAKQNLIQSFLPCFLGGKDTQKRNEQIYFIQQCKKALKIHLNPDNVFTYLASLKILVSVMLSIKAEITKQCHVLSGENSILVQLINEALGLDIEDNQLDDITKDHCILETQRLLNSELYFQAMCRIQERVSIAAWHELNHYIKTECDLINQKYSNPYPFASMMRPIFATPFEVIGSTTGFMIGNTLSNTLTIVPNQYSLPAAIGGGVCVMMGSNALGLVLLAPLITRQLLETFCSVSMAYILGAIMRILGDSVGWGVGFSLDMTRQLLQITYTQITQTFRETPKFPVINGYALVSGHRIQEGIKVDLVINPSRVLIEICEEGLIYNIDGNKSIISWSGVEQSPEMMALLEHLKPLEQCVDFKLIQSTL